jgi:hypothetical protein
VPVGYFALRQKASRQRRGRGSNIRRMTFGPIGPRGKESWLSFFRGSLAIA